MLRSPADLQRRARGALEAVESRLWSALRGAEEKVLPANAAYEELALSEYLATLARKVTPQSYIDAGGEPIQIKVRKDPRLNAGAMAHGLIVVNSGLIARAENEAQLAGVLAHEVAHITHRHQVREHRDLQNKQTAINVAAFVGTLALAAVAIDQGRRGNYATAQALTKIGEPLLRVGLTLTYTAMVTGYSRDMEREADEQAIRVMAAAGYPPQELARFFRIMRADGGDRGSIETFFWGNHPRLAERIETAEREARKIGVGGAATEQSGFERRTNNLRVANASWDAYLGRWSLARAQTERSLAFTPVERRDAWRQIAEAYLHSAASMGSRSRNESSDAEEHLRRAIAGYSRAIADGRPAEQAFAYRGLGHMHYANREDRSTSCDAAAAYAKYLELQPGARDVDSIRGRITELGCPTEKLPSVALTPTAPTPAPVPVTRIEEPPAAKPIVAAPVAPTVARPTPASEPSPPSGRKDLACIEEVRRSGADPRVTPGAFKYYLAECQRRGGN